MFDIRKEHTKFVPTEITAYYYEIISTDYKFIINVSWAENILTYYCIQWLD